jgi:hypothetical protein
MKISYEIDSTQGLFVARLSGVVALEELLEYTQEITSNPDYRHTLPALIDVRHASPALNREDLKRLAYAMAIRPTPLHDAPKALVVDEETAGEFRRIFEVLVEGGNEAIEVFHEPEAAWEWIGAPEPASCCPHGW